MGDDNPWFRYNTINCFLFSQLCVWFFVFMGKLDLNCLTAYKKLPPNDLQGWFQMQIFFFKIYHSRVFWDYSFNSHFKSEPLGSCTQYLFLINALPKSFEVFSLKTIMTWAYFICMISAAKLQSSMLAQHPVINLMVWFSGALFLSFNPVTCKYLIYSSPVGNRWKHTQSAKEKYFIVNMARIRCVLEYTVIYQMRKKKALTWDKWTVLKTNEEYAHSCSNSTILIPITTYYIAFMTMSIKIANIGPTPVLLSVIQIFSESCSCVEGTMRANWQPHLRQQKVEMEEHQKQKTKTLFYKSKKANIIPMNIIIWMRNLNCSILTPLKPTKVYHWDQWVESEFHTEI